MAVFEGTSDPWTGLFVSASGRLHAGINAQSGNEFDGNTTLSPGTWYHAVLTYDGSNLIVYLNGIEDGRLSIANQTVSNPNAPFTAIGKKGAVNGDYSNGAVDEVVIKDRALSADEIAKYYGGIVSARFSPSLDGGIRSDRPSLATWGDLRGGATDVSTTAPKDYLCRVLRSSISSAGWRDLHRGVMHFDSSSVPDGGIAITRAALEVRIAGKGDDLASSLVITPVNTAADSTISTADFDKYRAMELARTAFASLAVNAGNRIELDIVGINPAGASKFAFLVDRDFDNNEPPGVGDRYLEVDTSESANPPGLLVEYRSSGVSIASVRDGGGREPSRRIDPRVANPRPGLSMAPRTFRDRSLTP